MFLMNISVLVPLTRVSKRTTTGRLDNSLNFSVQHTKLKTQQVVKSRGRLYGDIELVTYLTNTTGPVSLVMNLRIVHDRFGSSSDLNLNGHLHHPNDIDRSLNDNKIQKYRVDDV
jgi:hypothetical protein